MNAMLQQMYDLNRSALHANTKGVTHEESLVHPKPAGNCMNWIVGHVIANRDIIFAFLNEPQTWTNAEAAPYLRGAPPLTDSSKARPFEGLLQDFERSQDRLKGAIARLTEKELERPVGPDKDPLGEALAFFHFHEAYHVGQTAVLRRIVGKEGAIK
jgi:uncharacterized damage-inducible protein DinB